MVHEAIATGKSVEDAINAACQKLDVDRENVEVEVIELPSKRLLGLLGATDAKVKVTYKETVKDKAKNFLKKVLEKMGFTDVVINISEKENGILIDLSGDDLGIIIGHRGETLDAIQYLTSLVANRGEETYTRIILDMGGYREKREKTLKLLAYRIATNSIKSRRSTTLEPMNPYERRIIHTAVQEIPGAASWSVGEEPNRRVVIGIENQNRRSGRKFVKK